MTISAARARKIADRIQRELAALFQREVSDPRFGMVTITGVDVDRELAFATVYISNLEGDERKDEILKALNRARGFFRSSLANRIPLRVFPQLRFRWDPSPDRGARVDELLEQLKREQSAQEDDTSDE